MDRVRNCEVRERAGIVKELASRVDQRVLRWFGHRNNLNTLRELMDAHLMARRYGWRK